MRKAGSGKTFSRQVRPSPKEQYAAIAGHPQPPTQAAEQIADVRMDMSGSGLIEWKGTGDDEADAWNNDEEYGATLDAVQKALAARADRLAKQQGGADPIGILQADARQAKLDVFVAAARQCVDESSRINSSPFQLQQHRASSRPLP